MNKENFKRYVNEWRESYDRVAMERDRYKKALEDIEGCGVYCTDGICPASKIAKQEIDRK